MSLENKDNASFEERLLQAQKRVSSENKVKAFKTDTDYNNSVFAMAMRIGCDLIAGIGLGAGLGYWIDYKTGCQPIFTFLFALLGFGAGMSNVWRVVNVSTPDVDAKKEQET